jgi:hypothetical protein
MYIRIFIYIYIYIYIYSLTIYIVTNWLRKNNREGVKYIHICMYLPNNTTIKSALPSTTHCLQSSKKDFFLVYVYKYIYIYIYIHIYVYMYIYIYIKYIYIYIYLTMKPSNQLSLPPHISYKVNKKKILSYICIPMCVYMYINTRIFYKVQKKKLLSYICIPMYIYMYMNINIHIYIYTYLPNNVTIKSALPSNTHFLQSSQKEASLLSCTGIFMR